MGERPVAYPARPQFRLHKSLRAESVADHNEGVLEGVCIVLDALHAAGYREAYEAMLQQLFVKPGERGAP